jgi:hypothetical protein
MWQKFKLFLASLFGSPSLQFMATVGIKVGLATHPELIVPTRLASQGVIDKVDGKEIVSVAMIEDLLNAELAKMSLSKDKYGLAQAAIATYKPMLVDYLAKISIPGMGGGLSDAQKKEIRALAVLVNNAAGGTAK